MNNHFDWPMPHRTDGMYLQTIKPEKHTRSISQDYKYMPEIKRTYLNKESFINKCADTITQQKMMNTYIKPEIEGAKPCAVKFRSGRSPTDPLEPVYRLPSYSVAPFHVDKFVRDTLNITDIDGTKPKGIRDQRRYQPTEIEGSKPRQPKPQMKIHVEVEAPRLQRHVDPLQPIYKWESQSIGQIEGAQPSVRAPDKNKQKSLSLHTADIKGAQHDTIIPHFKQNPMFNQTQDIQGAQPGTIQRGIKTKRQLHPLNPLYQYL